MVSGEHSRSYDAVSAELVRKLVESV